MLFGSPADGDVVTWDDGAQKLTLAPIPPGGATNLIELDDVTGVAGNGKAPVSDGAGHFPLTDVATQAELDTEAASRGSADTTLAAAVSSEATARAAGDTGAIATAESYTDSSLAAHQAAADPHTGYQKESEKGAASGYASLDGGGTVPDAQLPAALARDSEVSAAVAGEATARDVAIAAAIAALINSAPGVLNTLEEIADALGDDPNFAATMTAALAGKQPLDGELSALAALVSAADKLPYFTGLGTAALTTFTAFARTLVDDADATAARTTLGLGSIATQAASNVNITGGSVAGIVDLAVADGGTGASDADTARANLAAAAAAQQMIAGAGLTGGGTLAADRTFDVNVDGTTLEITGDTVGVKDGGITIPKLAFDPATQAELDAFAAQAVILAPAASSRNIIQPTAGAVIAAIVRAHAAQSVDLMQWQTSLGVPLLSIGLDGKIGIGARAGAAIQPLDLEVILNPQGDNDNNIQGTGPKPIGYGLAVRAAFPVGFNDFDTEYAALATSLLTMTDTTRVGSAIGHDLFVAHRGVRSPAGSSQIGSLFGQQIVVQDYVGMATGTIDDFRGQYIYASHGGLNKVGNLYGQRITFDAYDSVTPVGAVTGKVYGQYINGGVFDTINVSELTFCRLLNVSDGAATLVHGLKVDNMGWAGAVTSYGIRVLAQSGSSGAAYGIVVEGGKSVFMDALLIAVIAAPADAVFANGQGGWWWDQANSLPKWKGKTSGGVVVNFTPTSQALLDAEAATRAAADAALQPLDSDLTAIAALSTSAFGRALLTLADAAAMRSAAGTVIGTDVEAHDGDLTTIAGLAPTNDDVMQRKAGAWANRTLAQLISDLAALGTTFQPLDSDLTAIAALATSAYGRSVLALADAAALRVAAGLVIGTDVQAHDADLDTYASITPTAIAQSILAAANAAAVRTLLGLVIGTDVQAFDAELTALAGLTSAADKLPYFTGSGTAALADFTAAGRALVDDLTAAAQRTTLGLGTVAILDSDTDTGLAANSDSRVATQKAVKAYVDAVAVGLAIKQSCRVATAASLPANTYLLGVLTEVGNGALTVDGVVVTAGDRVLVKNEAAGANNGIYVVTAAGDGTHPYVLTRTSDMNTAAEVPGAFTFIEDGTVNSGGGFVVASSGPFTIGTTVITWTQFSGAGEITAGTGLGKAGNTLSITDAELLALAGLTSAADSLPYFTGSGAAALTTLTSFLRTLLDDADAATARATLGVVASLFQSGGSQAIKLDDLAAPDDNTDLNASTSAHGLLRKLDGNAGHYLDGTGALTTPSGGGPAADLFLYMNAR